MNHDAYTNAATAILTELCAATGMEPGKGGFLFYLPPQHSVFALYLSGGGDAGELAQCSPSYIRMDARVEARFVKPDDALRFVMQVLEIVPKDDFENIQRLHMVATPTVEAVFFVLANQEEPSLCYRVNIPMEANFSTA